MKFNPLSIASLGLIGTTGISASGLITNIVNKSEIKQIDDNYSSEIQKLSSSKSITLTDMDILDQASDNISLSIDEFKKDFNSYDFKNWYYSLSKYFEDNHSEDKNLGTVYNFLHRPRVQSLVLKDFVSEESEYSSPDYEWVLPIKEDWYTNFSAQDDYSLAYKVLYTEEQMKEIWSDLAKKILDNTSEKAIEFVKDKLILRFDFKFDYSNFIKMAHTRDPKVDPSIGDYNSVDLYINNFPTRITSKSDPYPYGRLHTKIEEDLRSNSVRSRSDISFLNGLVDGASFFYSSNEFGLNNKTFEVSSFNNTRQIISDGDSNSKLKGFNSYGVFTNEVIGNNTADKGHYLDYCNMFCANGRIWPFNNHGSEIETQFNREYFDEVFKNEIDQYNDEIFLGQEENKLSNIHLNSFHFYVDSLFNNSHALKHIPEYQNSVFSYNYAKYHNTEFQLSISFIRETDKILIFYRKPRKDDHWNKFLNNLNEPMGEIPIGILDYKLSVFIDPSLDWKGKYY